MPPKITYPENIKEDEKLGWLESYVIERELKYEEFQKRFESQRLCIDNWRDTYKNEQQKTKLLKEIILQALHCNLNGDYD